MLTPANYAAQRALLIDEDRSLRREFLRTDSYSDKEKEADKILRTIRALEATTIWNEEHPSIPHPFKFPGMGFLTGMWFPKQWDANPQYFTGKHIIMKTKVFEILSKVYYSFFSLYDPNLIFNDYLDAEGRFTPCSFGCYRQP